MTMRGIDGKEKCLQDVRPVYLQSILFAQSKPGENDFGYRQCLYRQSRPRRPGAYSPQADAKKRRAVQCPESPITRWNLRLLLRTCARSNIPAACSLYGQCRQHECFSRHWIARWELKGWMPTGYAGKMQLSGRGCCHYAGIMRCSLPGPCRQRAQ